MNKPYIICDGICRTPHILIGSEQEPIGKEVFVNGVRIMFDDNLKVVSVVPNATRNLNELRELDELELNQYLMLMSPFARAQR